MAAPSAAEKWAAVGELKFGGSWDKPITESGWVDGHQYDDEGNLLKVRCLKHGGIGFAAREATGSTVLM